MSEKILQEKEKVQEINADYQEKFGFHDPETGYAYKAPKGLTREIVEQISEGRTLWTKKVK